MKILEAGNPDEASDMAKAVEVAKILESEYPGHPWIVGVQGRAIVVRHLGLAEMVHQALGQAGFCARLPSFDTPAELRRCAINGGGMLLEAFGLPRGAWDGRPPVVPESLRALNVEH